MNVIELIFRCRFKESLNICLLQITGYSSLYISVEDLRKEVFSSDNPEHEAMLLKVWISAPRAIAVKLCPYAQAFC